MTWTAVVTTIAVIAALALVLVALFRMISTITMHRTIRKAVETNPDLAAGLLEKLTAPRESPRGDGRLPIVLIAIGIAMAAGPVIASDDVGMIRGALGGALFPLLVGGALWLRARAVERAKRRDGGE